MTSAAPEPWNRFCRGREGEPRGEIFRDSVSSAHTRTGCAQRTTGTAHGLHRGTFLFGKNKRLLPFKLLPNGFPQFCFKH